MQQKPIIFKEKLIEGGVNKLFGMSRPRRMSVEKHKNILISSLESKDKEDVLNFILESQIIEYGLVNLLSSLPYLNGPDLEDISEKSLGQLINEMVKTKDERLVGLIEKTRKFNELRKEIVHNLVYLHDSREQVLLDIKEKLKISADIKYEIDWHFNWVYENILDLPRGSIF